MQEFEDHRDADDAVYELNGKELLGERSVINLAMGLLAQLIVSLPSETGHGLDSRSRPTFVSENTIVGFVSGCLYQLLYP